MKPKLLLQLLLIVVISSGCSSLNNLTQPKPVLVNGLGSLQFLKGRKLDRSELLKVVKAVGKQTSVNSEDVATMLEIYEHQTKDFLSASGFFVNAADAFTVRDVEKYLALMLQHEKLRDEVEQATQAAIVGQIAVSAAFDENDKYGSGGTSGGLAGAYVNAYRQAVAEDDEVRRSILNKRQDNNASAVVQGFEQAALEVVEGKRANVTLQQKREAAKFLADLRAYNASLPADEKMLDENGRLVNPAQMTGGQQSAIANIFRGSENQARRALSDRMSATYDKLTVYTQAQIK